jgi:hypothetical protein
MPIFRLNKAFSIWRNVNASLNMRGGITRLVVPGAEQREDQAGTSRDTRRRTPEQREKVKSIRRELSRRRSEHAEGSKKLHAARHGAKLSKRVKQIKRVKKKRQEIFRLQNELRAAELGTGGEPETGALPDFVVIGAPKCGTTFFYDLLTKHPLVEPAAFKELHYFDLLFDEGTEWYRQCFPPPKWKDGRRSITGEATPRYLSDPLVPERMARVVPEARLVVLLRNPVDRMYSAYHQRVRNNQATRTFEEHAEACFDDPQQECLARNIYVDHLLRWSSFFSDGQMLVLKSEDFFERPESALKPTLEFLGLPDWVPEASELGNKLNRGKYEQRMDPATRQRLEDYFEPHNRRLYDYLGVDFRW